MEEKIIQNRHVFQLYWKFWLSDLHSRLLGNGGRRMVFLSLYFFFLLHFLQSFVSAYRSVATSEMTPKESRYDYFAIFFLYT